LAFRNLNGRRTKPVCPEDDAEADIAQNDQRIAEDHDAWWYMWPSKSMIERGDDRHSGKTEKRKADDPFADTNAVGYCRPQNTNGLGM
jgi:hypothetical protein